MLRILFERERLKCLIDCDLTKASELSKLCSSLKFSNYPFSYVWYMKYFNIIRNEVINNVNVSWCVVMILELKNVAKWREFYVFLIYILLWLWVDLFVEFISCAFISCHKYLHRFWIWICVRWLGPRSLLAEIWCRGLCRQNYDVEICTCDIVTPRSLPANYDVEICCDAEVFTGDNVMLRYYQWWCGVEVIAGDYCISISSLHILA